MGHLLSYTIIIVLFLVSVISRLPQVVASRERRWAHLQAGAGVWFRGEPLDPMDVYISTVPQNIYESELDRWGSWVRDVEVHQKEDKLPADRIERIQDRDQLGLIKMTSSLVWNKAAEHWPRPEPGINLHDWLRELGQRY